jgi:hypothetical protein
MLFKCKPVLFWRLQQLGTSVASTSAAAPALPEVLTLNAGLADRMIDTPGVGLEKFTKTTKHHLKQANRRLSNQRSV